MNEKPVTQEDLHAYVDGRLPLERCAQVEAYLEAHPDEAQRVDDYRRLNLALRALYEPGTAEPPARRPRSRPLQRVALAAGLAAMLVFSGAVGWWLHGEVAPHPMFATLPQQAAFAHVVYAPDVRHPVEVDASQEAHLVQWLSKRLGHELTAPSLAKAGFSLIGGRLLPAEGDAAAQFMYENASGARLTLYVRPADGDTTAFRYTTQDKVGVFYWVDRPFAYAISGTLEREALLEIAHLTYSQLQDTRRLRSTEYPIAFH